MRRQVEENDGSMLIRLPSTLKKRVEALAKEKHVSVAEVARVAFAFICDNRNGVPWAKGGA